MVNKIPNLSDDSIESCSNKIYVMWIVENFVARSRIELLSSD